MHSVVFQQALISLMCERHELGLWFASFAFRARSGNCYHSLEESRAYFCVQLWRKFVRPDIHSKKVQFLYTNVYFVQVLGVRKYQRVESVEKKLQY